MRKSFLTRIARLLLMVLLMASIFAPGARAASQTITASMTSVTNTGFALSLSWSAAAGATKYDVRYTTTGDVQLASSSLYTSTSATSLNATMDTNVGYRYFRIYAYDSSNTLLAYSNVVGVAKYQSGLVIRMKLDSVLTSTYWDPASSPDPAKYQKPVWFITVDSSVRAAYAAPSFQIGEFIHDTTLTSAVVDPKMVQHAQNAHDRYGTLIVNSGYRTPNEEMSLAGGVKYGRHTYGDAADYRAQTQADYDALKTAFAPENPSYVEPFSSSNPHFHADFRNETTTKGYSNW